MGAHPIIATRVTAETKSRFGALAQRHEISASALLKRLIDVALLNGPDGQVGSEEAAGQPPRDLRVYVRLRPEDHLLLRERAAARDMAAATYASILLRAHLRALRPLPERELGELKRAVAELGAIGRNLNQIARVANQTGKAPGAPQSAGGFARSCEGAYSSEYGKLGDGSCRSADWLICDGRCPSWTS
jgi:hypothetical protein